MKMKPVTNAILDQLDLVGAVEREAATVRNQLPPEPWMDAVATGKDSVARWVHDRLRSGIPAVPSTTVQARKIGLGTRPVAIMGIAERVAYRALAELVVPPSLLPDRSAEAYKNFVMGPINHAFLGQGSWVFANSIVGYVVEADIAAFYQYIDHDVLQRELELQAGNVDTVAVLIELLGEAQQRSFGLPQLIDASDWLSELYIRIVERDLVRQGWPVWRFNDDFRIGCGSFAEALHAVESLERSAQAVGLTVADSKTYAQSFLNYFMKYTNRDVSDTTIPIDPSDVEVILTEYADFDEAEEVSAALATLERIEIPNEKETQAIELPASAARDINLRDASRDEVRLLRRAVSALSRHPDPDALRHVTELLIFVPSLTPRLCDFLVAVDNPETRAQVEAIVDEAIDTVSLGEWQAAWFVFVCRRLSLLDDAPHRVTWVEKQRERGRGNLLGADAALTLALAGRNNFDDCDRALRSEPQSLAPWYLLAIDALVIGDPDKHGARARSIRNESPLNRLLVSDAS